MPAPKHPRACDKIDEHVGVRVRTLRRAQDMTQTELGDRLKVSHQQIQKYEIGRNRISVGRLVAIAKILKEPLGAFLPEGIAL